MSAILASELINLANDHSQPISEAMLIADCKVCVRSVKLSECTITRNTQVQYDCPRCQSILLIISPLMSEAKPWPGRGYRLCGFLFRNAVDIHYGNLRFDRSPNALAKEGE